MRAVKQLFSFVAITFAALALCVSCETDGEEVDATSTYTVTFDYDDDGATESTQATVDEGETITLPANPEREGYTFDGWYYDGAKWSDESAVTADITIVAKWTIVSYTVTFKFNYEGADPEDYDTDTVEYGGVVSEPKSDPERDGYEFDGWYTDATLNGGEEEYIFGKVITGDLTLYANWAIETNSVTFYYNYEGADPTTFGEKVDVDYGSTVSKPSPNPERTGYEFTNWYTEATCENVYDFGSEVTSALKLYADWKINTYDVTFNYNYGSGDADYSSQPSAEVVAVDYNSAATEMSPEPTRAGHIFEGWYETAACDGAEYGFNTGVTDDIDLYAKWSAAAYSITYYSDTAMGYSSPGDPYDTQSYDPSTNSYAPTTPTATGYIFDGWYDNTDCTGSVYTFGSTLSASVILYAKWTAQTQYTVTFYSSTDNNYGTLPEAYKTESVYDGDKVSPPSDPTDDSVSFLGWYTTTALDTEYNFETMTITAETKIYAKWSGTSVILIASEADLIDFRNKINDGTYDSATDAKLTTSFSMSSGTSWIPIGNSTDLTYSGTFDGNGHTITGLYISVSTGNFLGLFGVIDGATIKDLTIATPSITGSNSTSSAVAALVGSVLLNNNAINTISNCTVSGGSISASNQVGAIVGGNSGNITVTNCHNVGCSVTGAGNYIAGVFGRMAFGYTGSDDLTQRVVYCSNSGVISAKQYGAGIVGYPSYGAEIIACHNTGGVTTSSSIAGGIAGGVAEDSAYIYGCYNTGKVTGVTACGGIIGNNTANKVVSVKGCYNSGEVYKTGAYAGGIIAVYNTSSSDISDDFSYNYFYDASSADSATACVGNNAANNGTPTDDEWLLVTSISDLNDNVSNMNSALTAAGVTGYEFKQGSNADSVLPTLSTK